MKKLWLLLLTIPLLLGAYKAVVDEDLDYYENGSTSFDGTSPAGILYINTGNTATASTLNIIDANGNVGIGYTLPVGTLQVGTSPTPGLIVTAIGNVGIGTTGPNAPLTLKAITNGKTVFRIQESDSTTAAFQISVSPTGASLSGLNSGGQVFQISSSDGTNTFFYNAANTGIGTNSPRAMFQVGTSPIAGLVVTSSENVGIGTTSPLGLLQVGTSPFPGLMVTTAGNTGVGTTNPSARLEVIGSGDNSFSTNVGIGTTAPLALLQVGTSPFAPLFITSSNAGIGTTSPVTLLQVGTAPNAVLSVEAGGQIGIGTTNPTTPLTVICANTAPANNLYLKGSIGARLIISQQDGGCSSCGVDSAGTTWACIDITCP